MIRILIVITLLLISSKAFASEFTIQTHISGEGCNHVRLIDAYSGEEEIHIDSELFEPIDGSETYLLRLAKNLVLKSGLATADELKIYLDTIN